MSPNLQHWLGGSPGAVLVKLIVLSLIVGMFMAFLGLTPMALIDRLLQAFRSIFDLGFDAVRDILRYVVYGAVIVVPIWLVSRLLRTAR
jgi:hypothetical protein